MNVYEKIMNVVGYDNPQFKHILNDSWKNIGTLKLIPPLITFHKLPFREAVNMTMDKSKKVISLSDVAMGMEPLFPSVNSMFDETEGFYFVMDSDSPLLSEIGKRLLSFTTSIQFQCINIPITQESCDIIVDFINEYPEVKDSLRGVVCNKDMSLRYNLLRKRLYNSNLDTVMHIGYSSGLSSSITIPTVQPYSDLLSGFCYKESKRKSAIIVNIDDLTDEAMQIIVNYLLILKLNFIDIRLDFDINMYERHHESTVTKLVDGLCRETEK